MSIALPFLIALIPVLFLYSNNVDQVRASDTFVSIGVLFALATIVFLSFLLFFRNVKKASVATSLTLILFFSYGHAFSLKEEFNIRLRYLVGMWVFLTSAELLLVTRTKRDLSSIVGMLAVFAGFMIAISLVTIAVFKINSVSKVPVIDTQVSGVKANRDIYYILLDGYASQWSLNTIYNYDNGPFLDELVRIGFYVVEKSRSNYPNTTFSLPSTLNMDYVQNLVEGELSRETYNHRALLQNNAVATFLQQQGYKYIHVGSWWDPTRKNRRADININSGYMPEFVSTLYNSVAFGPLNLELFDVRREQFDRINYQLKELEQISNDPSATFTFIHFNMSPYVFDDNGEFLESSDEINAQRPESLLIKYPKQITFFNREVLKLVTRIRADSSVPPIIVIQSDHGSRYFAQEGITKVEDVPDIDVRERLRNLSALYLPDGGDALLYDDMTNVNTFRFIFNFYFGTELEILPDRTYLAPPGKHYDFVDVTSRASYE
jgi:hypothetical protein